MTHGRLSDSAREREFEFLWQYVRGDQDHQVHALYENSIGRVAQSLEATSVTVRAKTRCIPKMPNLAQASTQGIPRKLLSVL